jgi:hypothetical protein
MVRDLPGQHSDFDFPIPEKRGGLNGSVQDLLAVYLREFQIPKFFLDVDLPGIAVVPERQNLKLSF